MTIKKDEARQDPRITKVLPVDCKIVELSPEHKSGQGLKVGQKIPARTINVSKNGVLINSDFEIDIKTKVELSIAIKSRGEAKTIHIRAEVARARRNAWDLYGRWGMGLKILQIDPKELSLVSDYFLEASN